MVGQLKEDVAEWYQGLSAPMRVEAMCTLLDLSMPFEIRFLGSLIEHLGRKDFGTLRDAESKANSFTNVNPDDKKKLLKSLAEITTGCQANGTQYVNPLMHPNNFNDSPGSRPSPTHSSADSKGRQLSISSTDPLHHHLNNDHSSNLVSSTSHDSSLNSHDSLSAAPLPGGHLKSSSKVPISGAPSSTSSTHSNHIVGCSSEEETESMCISNDHKRRKLILYVSVLQPTNHDCANLYYTLLSDIEDSPVLAWLEELDKDAQEEVSLLYTLASRHPAFTFEQRMFLGRVATRVNEIIGTKFPSRGSTATPQDTAVVAQTHHHNANTNNPATHPVYINHAPIPQAMDPKYAATGGYYFFTAPQMHMQPAPPHQHQSTGVSNNGEAIRNSAAVSGPFPAYGPFGPYFVSHPHHHQAQATLPHPTALTPHYAQNLMGSPMQIPSSTSVLATTPTGPNNLHQAPPSAGPTPNTSNHQLTSSGKGQPLPPPHVISANNSLSQQSCLSTPSRTSSSVPFQSEANSVDGDSAEESSENCDWNSPESSPFESPPQSLTPSRSQSPPSGIPHSSSVQSVSLTGHNSATFLVASTQGSTPSMVSYGGGGGGPSVVPVNSSSNCSTSSGSASASAAAIVKTEIHSSSGYVITTATSNSASSTPSCTTTPSGGGTTHLNHLNNSTVSSTNNALSSKNSSSTSIHHPPHHPPPAHVSSSSTSTAGARSQPKNISTVSANNNTNQSFSILHPPPPVVSSSVISVSQQQQPPPPQMMGGPVHLQQQTSVLTSVNNVGGVVSHSMSSANAPPLAAAVAFAQQQQNPHGAHNNLGLNTSLPPPPPQQQNNYPCFPHMSFGGMNTGAAYRAPSQGVLTRSPYVQSHSAAAANALLSNQMAIKGSDGPRGVHGGVHGSLRQKTPLQNTPKRRSNNMGGGSGGVNNNNMSHANSTSASGKGDEVSDNSKEMNSRTNEIVVSANPPPNKGSQQQNPDRTSGGGGKSYHHVSNGLVNSNSGGGGGAVLPGNQTNSVLNNVPPPQGGVALNSTSNPGGQLQQQTTTGGNKGGGGGNVGEDGLLGDGGVTVLDNYPPSVVAAVAQAVNQLPYHMNGPQLYGHPPGHYIQIPNGYMTAAAASAYYPSPAMAAAAAAAMGAGAPGPSVVPPSTEIMMNPPGVPHFSFPFTIPQSFSSAQPPNSGGGAGGKQGISNNAKDNSTKSVPSNNGGSGDGSNKSILLQDAMGGHGGTTIAYPVGPSYYVTAAAAAAAAAAQQQQQRTPSQNRNSNRGVILDIGGGALGNSSLSPVSVLGDVAVLPPLDEIVETVHRPRKISCYNCGASNHLGPDCKEGSMEEMTRHQFRVNYSGPSTVTADGGKDGGD